MSEHFRRVNPRYERRLEVEVEVEGKRERTTSKNISIGGMFLEAQGLADAGAKVQVRFKLPTEPDPIAVEADVCWAGAPRGDDPGGIGIRFRGLRAHDVWALNRFFQA